MNHYNVRLELSGAAAASAKLSTRGTNKAVKVCSIGMACMVMYVCSHVHIRMYDWVYEQCIERLFDICIHKVPFLSLLFSYVVFHEKSTYEVERMRELKSEMGRVI